MTMIMRLLLIIFRYIQFERCKKMQENFINFEYCGVFGMFVPLHPKNELPWNQGS